MQTEIHNSDLNFVKFKLVWELNKDYTYNKLSFQGFNQSSNPNIGFIYGLL